MGEFFLDAEKVRVDFPDGQWVDVKEELTQADQDYIITQMARAEQNGGKARLELTLGQLSLLERSILDWSFTEADKKIPISRDTISRLRRRYREKITAEVNRLNNEAQEFIKKN